MNDTPCIAGLYFSLVTAQLAKDEEIAEAMEEEDMVEDLETGMKRK